MNIPMIPRSPASTDGDQHDGGWSGPSVRNELVTIFAVTMLNTSVTDHDRDIDGRSDRDRNEKAIRSR
jgi:hypothetical protein